ncbi:MAG: sugar ABC transporter substrate-binding protein [Spirochaetales bacterium]|nr:sugar ABC transporter substrate-binding protein [Spirochaetales bacterium]
MRRALLVVGLCLLAAGLVFAGGQGEKKPEAAPAGASNLEESLKADAVAVTLKAPDGQPLVFEGFIKQFPKRPANPEALPNEDPGRWYDFEYAGWSTDKINIPKSPADGSIGKKIIMVAQGEHPYYTAYTNAAKEMAKVYGINLKITVPNWDLNTQNQYIDQAINERPNLIILLPLDANASLGQYKKINEAGIPVIAAHMLASEEALRYCLLWTGPDEWAPRRELSKLLAEKLNYKGGYAIMSHNPGGSTYFSRGYGYVSTLSQIAPNMKLLDLQSPGFDAEKSKQLALDWIKRFRGDLNAIIAADDGPQMVGIIEACAQAGREDIVLIAAGNSKVGMDGVKAGKILAINYESPAACAATAVKVAADWFNGKDVPRAVYLPPVIITKENVEDFYPPQW